MGALVRLARTLPLLIIMAVVAAIAYLVISWLRSPNRAKELIIKASTVVNAVLAVFFTLASVYALFEDNRYVLELTATFAILNVIALLITRVCRWRFVRNHPEFELKPTKTRFL